MKNEFSREWNIGKEMSDYYELFGIVFYDIERWQNEQDLILYLENKDFVYVIDGSENYLDIHFLQHIGNEKDPLNLTLKAHLYVENFLEEILRKKFRNSSLLLDNRDFTFALKLDILRAKNYLDERLYKDIRLLNRLRNKFAHDLSFDISTFDMSQFCYCEDLYRSIKVKSHEAKRLVNTYILRTILWQLLLRLMRKHESIRNIKID